MTAFLPSSPSVFVIGGGAAGFFAAIHAKTSCPHNDVILIEKTTDLLAKVKISGGGRCNVTHACFDPSLLCHHYPRGHKELLGAFHQFQPKDTVSWFKSHGVALKIEKDNRIFPTSNTSQTIVDCLVNLATKLGIKLWTSCTINTLTHTPDGFSLILSTSGHTYTCKKVILATGSNRSGYALATSLGHTIVPPVPSLFSFTITDKSLHLLAGLSVESISIHLVGHEKKVQTGPLLITHWGISGPAVITLSAWHARTLATCLYKGTIIINWLPGFTLSTIVSQLNTLRAASLKKEVGSTSPFSKIPNRLWQYLCQKSGVVSKKRWGQLHNTDVQNLALLLHHTELPLAGKGSFKDEFVTCGGVCLKEINFKTMESKRCKGLHIVGELLDIDGLTGGFNFQNAWTTGFIAGTSLT